ncbi:MAG: M42 family metallopeptidase [Phycisphaerae bacterium]|jgi:endoglucanase|nr:M42 family metallopeptidase [Phycisphaerae bacterium]
MRKESLEFLRQLLTTPSPSGFESPGQKVWADYARKYADDVHTDSYGNAIAVLNPEGSPRIMLDGHADELGLMVKHIDDKGFVYFQRIGGVDPAVVRTKRVDIYTAKGVVRGVIGATAIHLQDRTKDSKAPKMHECFIDIGAKDGKAARKRVAVGDPITFVDSFELLDKNIGVARAFDNRVGTWSAIEALRLAGAAKKKLNCAIIACSSVQEEVGGAGAQMNVVNLTPDAAIAIDVTHATDTPGIDAKQHGEVKMSNGPSITIGREHHPVLVKRIRDIAKKKKINLQIEAFSLTGGTDAMAIHNKIGGVPSSVIGIPNRYMHTTVEMLDLRDLQKTAELLAAFCLDLKKGEMFKVKV